MNPKDLNIINSLPAINLEELAAVDFESRSDTKYIFPAGRVTELLEKIEGDVVVLEVSGNRIFKYLTRYFDTPDMTFFKEHQAGYLNRIKVRARAYSENGPYVIEIKHKSNKRKTVKDRLALNSMQDLRSETSHDFLGEKLGFGFESLPHSIDVEYDRITFATKDLTEKFTLDLNLSYQSGSKNSTLNNLAIAEVKQEQFKFRSPLISALKEMRIRPSSFSKYCTGIMKTNPEIKHNRFKPILRKLEKIESYGIVA